MSTNPQIGMRARVRLSVVAADMVVWIVARRVRR
jgi:hypothetical protein